MKLAKENEYTTLKIRKTNINRLFKLKQSQQDTFDDVITRLLNEKEKSAKAET